MVRRQDILHAPSDVADAAVPHGSCCAGWSVESGPSGSRSGLRSAQADHVLRSVCAAEAMLLKAAEAKLLKATDCQKSGCVLSRVHLFFS